jgi:hypothetical protein
MPTATTIATVEITVTILLTLSPCTVQMMTEALTPRKIQGAQHSLSNRL